MCLYVVYRFRAIYTFLFLYRWQILLKGGTQYFLQSLYFYIWVQKSLKSSGKRLVEDKCLSYQNLWDESLTILGSPPLCLDLPSF